MVLDRYQQLLESVCSSLQINLARQLNLDVKKSTLVLVYLLEDLQFTDEQIEQAKQKAIKELTK